MHFKNKKMGLLLLFCVIYVAFTGLTSGAGVLPDSVNAAVGGSVMFTTSLDPTQTPFILIIWSFGTKNIITSTDNTTGPEYEGRITLFISTGSLELRNVVHSDAGEYSAGILPAVGPQINGLTTLKVYEPVSNVRVTVNDTDLVEFNSSVSLSCSASGPSLSFLWLNHSSEVTASDRVHLTDGGSTLTIVSVSRYDQGPFTCKVANPVSSSTSDPVNLSVSYGPDEVTLKADPTDEYHKEGSDISLSCSADSRPEAQFKWFLNGELLSFTGAQIKLENVQRSGNYSCQAFNNKTLRYTTSQPALISVITKISGAVISSIHIPLEGTSFSLTCDASGSIFSREWMKNGFSLNSSENIVFYDQNRVLSIKNLNRKNKGEYTCNISNIFSSENATYVMNVNYGPENVQISGPKEIQVNAMLKLSCSAESEPEANYTWIRDGVNIANSSEYTKYINGNTDGGEYVCQANNYITRKISNASHTVLVQEIVTNKGCSSGCIIGIVFGCIAFALVVFGAVYYILKKRKPKKKSSTPTGQDNSAYAQNQEVNYADVMFVKKEGGVVHLGVQNNTEYAEVQKNNNPPASHLSTYNAHMQRERRPAPQLMTTGTEYAEVRRK